MGQIDDLLKRIEEESKREYLPIIGPQKARFLTGLINEQRPRRAVEVGMMTGYATAVIAAALPEGGHLYSIEMNRESCDRALINLKAAGLDSRVTVEQGDALEVLDRLEGPFDLVLLDGLKSQYAAYLRRLKPKLSVGALVVANGVGEYHGQVQDYLDYLQKSGQWETDTETFGDDAMEISYWKG